MPQDQNEGLQIVKRFLFTNKKTEDNFITTLLLSKEVSLKEKELLLFIHHLSEWTPELKTGVESRATFSLNDLHKLKIAYPSTASKLLKQLRKNEIIIWDKANHEFQINKVWVSNTLIRLENTSLEHFYKLLLKQK